MARARPDHSDAMQNATGRTRLRSRRRRRRVLRGMIRTVFWSFVLAGVFILGLGFGRTIAVEDELSSDDVTITSDLGPIQATLPTRTETVTKTVTVPAAKAKAAKRPAASAVPER